MARRVHEQNRPCDFHAGGVPCREQRRLTHEGIDEANDCGARPRGRSDHLRGPSAGHSDHPCRMDHPRRRGQILDDAPAAGIPRSRQDLQNRVVAVPGHLGDVAGADRRRPRLRHTGCAADRARRRRRHAQCLHRGRARGRKAGQLFGLLGRQGRQPDQDGRRPQGQDGRHQHHRRRHAGPVQSDVEEERH